MNKHILALTVVVASAAAVAQSAPPPQATKVCVAQIRNQTAAKLDTAKLREGWLKDLQGTSPAQDGTVTFVTMEADSSDVATDALRQAGCEFAIYTRVFRKPKEKIPPGWDSGSSIIIGRTDKPELETYGLQCTVERASTGMPILIDRQFDAKPAQADTAVPKLLAAEVQKIGDALAKKLAK